MSFDLQAGEKVRAHDDAPLCLIGLLVPPEHVVSGEVPVQYQWTARFCTKLVQLLISSRTA
jgi:hypothetical protein